MSPRQRAETLQLADAANRQHMTFAEFRRDVLHLEDSPLVAAIVAATDGTPITTLSDEECKRYFGTKSDRMQAGPWRTVVVRAGGRGGKSSRLLAPKALHALWSAPIPPTLAAGEEPYALIVAPTRDLARQTFSFCKGYVETCPELRAALVGDIGAETLALRRPDGTVCRLRVFAVGHAGAQLRARNLLFVGVDEAALFRDKRAAVSDEEVYRAVSPRVVVGGQIWLVSTPWIAGRGLMEEFFRTDFGKPDIAMCVTAPTAGLFPNWDPTGKREAEIRRDPDNYEREILAIPLSSTSATFFAEEAVKAQATGSEKLPYNPRATYGAGADFAFKRDSSALAIVEGRTDDEGVQRFRVAAMHEERPVKNVPLTAAGVLGAIDPYLAEYETRTIAADSHERDEVTMEAEALNVAIVAAPEGQAGKAETYAFLRKLIHEGRIELPDNDRLVRQLLDVVSKPTPGGGLTITSPRRATGGHGDLVSALVLACWRAKEALGDDPDDAPKLLAPGRRGTF